MDTLLEHLYHLNTMLKQCVSALFGCRTTYEEGILAGMVGTLMQLVFLQACANYIMCLRSFPTKTTLGALTQYF